MGALPGWRAYEGQLALEKYKVKTLERNRAFAFFTTFAVVLLPAVLGFLLVFWIFKISSLNLLFLTFYPAIIPLGFYLFFAVFYASFFSLQINYPENLLWSKTYREVKFPWRLKKKE